MAKVTWLFGTFGALSDEIVIHILHFCKYEGILRFAASSKRYYNLVSNSVSLQLHIELEANGLEIVKGSHKGDATYPLLLDEIVRYRDAWLSLKLEKPTEQIVKERNEILMWQLREGNYVASFSSAPSLSWGPDSLRIVPLGCADIPNPITFEINFHEFTSYLHQDLVTLIRTDPNDDSRLEIRFCSATTGLSHPLARSPIIMVQVNFAVPSAEDHLETFNIEVMDNIFVARVADLTNRVYELLVWDWKSGTLLTRVGSNSDIADFAFLDKAHLAVFTVNKMDLNTPTIALSVYAIPLRTCDEIPSGSYFCVSEYDCARPILTFEFPTLHPLYDVQSTGFSLRSEPVPGRTVYAKSTSFAHPTALTFIASVSLVDTHPHLPMSFEDASDRFAQFRIFISAKHLLCYLPDSLGQSDTVVIPWNIWGIQATRWFLCNQEVYDWLYWTYGPRFVKVELDAGSVSALKDLSIFDFHLPTVRRLESRGPDYSHPTHPAKETIKNLVLEGNGLSVVQVLSSELHTSSSDADPQLRTVIIGSDMPTIIMKGFSAPVESRLPYRVATRPKCVPSCEEWLIDGNHIIGLSPFYSGPEVLERVITYELQT